MAQTAAINTIFKEWAIKIKKLWELGFTQGAMRLKLNPQLKQDLLKDKDYLFRNYQYLSPEEQNLADDFRLQLKQMLEIEDSLADPVQKDLPSGFFQQGNISKIIYKKHYS